MPEYVAPGVYVEEIERGPRPIDGVPTSTAAFLGEAERGSITPRLVTSYGEYVRWFGGPFDETKFLPYAVSGFFENGGTRLFVCRVVGAQATTAHATFGDFEVRAVGPGAWGQRVWARIDDSTTRKPDGTPVGFRLRLAYWSSMPQSGLLFDPFDSANQNMLPRPSQIEDFDDLATDQASSDNREKRLIDDAKYPNSALAVLVKNADTAVNAAPSNGSQTLSQEGTDDPAVLTPADYEGIPVAGTAQHPKPQGLAALELDPYRDVALVYAPGQSAMVNKAVISHCEKMRFRFAVVDPDRNVDVADLQPRIAVQDTAYAALYYPWIAIAAPQTGARKIVPPGGHVLGVYVRTDSERGVFKAPANEILRGALDLAVDIDESTQEILNPRGVNVIRRFAGRGVLVWGARTLSSDTLWKYISVRRLLIFLERSIYEGTQWVVFEPNDDRLWARVSDTIRLFLRTQWRLGALFGRTENEAFFVTCDRTTMSQDDILYGRLICEIGIAPVRSAEFVIFRIFQNTAEAQP